MDADSPTGRSPMGMSLRPLGRGEEAALADLWFESWRSVGLERPVVTRDELRERVVRELAERWDVVTLAETGGAIVGFLALSVCERRLDQLFIAPSAQGRGVGRALFETAKQRLPNGFWLSTQAANGRARAFYEARGMALDRVEKDPSGDRVFFLLPKPSP